MRSVLLIVVLALWRRPDRDPSRGGIVIHLTT